MNKKQEIYKREGKNGLKKSRKIGPAILCIVIMIGAFLGIYNFRNYRLYKYIISNENENIDIYYNFNYMLIWNKTLNYIRENKKEVRFIGKHYTTIVPSYDISKFYHFNLDIYNEVSKAEEFKNLDTCIIDLSKFSDEYAAKKISFKVNDILLNNSYVDIYKYEDNVPVLLDKNILVDNDGSIEILREHDESKKYLIVCVPLRDIEVENNKIEINNNTSINIKLKTVPENATYGKLNYYCDNENLIITQDGVINAKKAGEYKVQVNDINKNVTKEIIVKVNPIAEEIRVDKSSISVQMEKSSKINAYVIPGDAINKELIFESSDEGIATVDNQGNVSGINIGECYINIKTIHEPIIENSVKIIVTKKTSYEENNVSGVTYINGVLIANKKYSLPSNYNPGIDPTALNAYYEMKNAANQLGFSLEIMSGFRSYETQKGLYNRYVNTYGQAEADTFSAKPGHSEHQTGLAFDLGWVDDEYADTAEGKWLAENCYKYGFIIRYPKNKEAITGYKYEPWHVRYLGNPLATDVYNSGLCLEEYLGI
ncbi:MAG: D-alanyl-D-alanine carboxypeptidase family protein [Clostridia bacterium]|nr:D-alanyl-D-alanine carboxypeptidase family protein [Clostridia bacterium]